MSCALVTVLLVFSLFSANCINSNTRGSTHEHGDLSDDVQLLQMAINVDSRKEKAGSSNTANKKVALQRYYIHRQGPEANANDFANISSVSLNSAGDLPVFLAGVEFDMECVILFLICFAILLRCLPNIYAFRATGAYLEGKKKLEAQDAPRTWEVCEKSYFKWMWYSFAPTAGELIDANGLDAAMLLAFTEMAMEICAAIGIPFLLIGCPSYAYLGGMAAGDDRLSHLGIGNVELGSWLFWPLSISTWFVVIFTQWRLFQWMRMFIGFHEKFLLSMPEPHRTTVLVEGIPDDLCSDAALKEYFSRMYGKGLVKEAYVIKKIATLEQKVIEYKYADRKLRETRYYMKHHPDKPKPRFHLMHGGQDCDEYYKSELERLAAEIQAEQFLALREAQKAPEDSDIYATNGFVTFDSRKHAEQAMGTRLRIADDELVVSYPPMPNDVIWADLEQAIAKRHFYHLIGYSCIAGLFFCFMPIVLAISQAADLDNLENKYPAFKSFTDALGDYRDTLASTMASLGLTIMMSFLPTFLLLILNCFFTLKAHRWAQLYLQTYYFWFLVLFVLLVTAVGSSLSDFLAEIAESPLIIFSVLAQTMPLTTHFYLNYIPLQWVTHAMNLLRYINLTKYLLFKRVMEPEDARSMSEPEDQDYYGMGSRSAQFAFMLILGLVFSSICPLMLLMTFLNFFMCRLFYGYLISYAESKKEDLGGDHFALQLIHVHLGLLIYIIMMTGIMLERASSYGPGIISGASFLWWALSFNKFRTKLHWQTLCYEDVVDLDKKVKIPVRDSQGSYVQDALDPKILQKIKSNPYDD